MVFTTTPLRSAPQAPSAGLISNHEILLNSICICSVRGRVREHSDTCAHGCPNDGSYRRTTADGGADEYATTADTHRRADEYAAARAHESAHSTFAHGDGDEDATTNYYYGNRSDLADRSPADRSRAEIHRTGVT